MQENYGKIDDDMRPPVPSGMNGDEIETDNRIKEIC